MNWRFFCIFGMIWSLLWFFIDHSRGNIVGAEIQLIFGLAYTVCLTYLSLKGKNKE
jgi:hypothetical protein